MPLCLSTFSGTDRQNCVSGYLVYGLESCTPFLVAADELAYSRVLAHEAHGLHFRGRVYGAGDEMCLRSVYLYVAPASLLRSLSISTYRIANRHTHSAPISRASVCYKFTHSQICHQ